MPACLMAPLTCYRRPYSLAAQLRANSWMLMTGSLGMLASTLPVQWLLPTLGWRGLFWAVAAMLALAMAGIAWLVPADARAAPAGLPSGGSAGANADGNADADADADADAGTTPHPPVATAGYRSIVRHPLFLRLALLGFVIYGGLIAVQSLWAGPWLTRVGGWSSEQAAQGLFFLNLRDPDLDPQGP